MGQPLTVQGFGPSRLATIPVGQEIVLEHERDDLYRNVHNDHFFAFTHANETASQPMLGPVAVWSF